MFRDNVELDDAEVVRAVQRGDKDKFELLVTKYQARVYRIAHYYLHDHEEARDISQEAFLLAYKHISSFRGDAKFSTWFVRIVINLSLNRIRTRRSPTLWDRWRGTDGSDEVAAGDVEPMVSRLPDRALNPEQQVLGKELGTRIRRAVDRLPDKQKTVFLLRHMDGLSIKEICEVTKIVEGTVKSYLSRAAARVHDAVKRYHGKR
ncbi:MAG: sigma-70 family RNA polymerase sigma factor [Acidobacteria bacterium]|nr:sigma-70 family RNA polymerase sigma factor [Acidobacteriota bacterium]MBI3658799.1 sigma-70 family RNA polymerase sigma factor [Acidobacteriota bacterium]